MNYKGQRVYLLTVEKEVQFYKLTGNVIAKLLIERSISARAALESVKEVVDYLVEREIVVKLYSCGIDIFHIKEVSSSVLTKIHKTAYVLGRGYDIGSDDRLIGYLDLVGCGEV